ncbi:MAG TPA: hypothetical protein VGM92_11440, partial [Candidatus Kapabacteria bacterium]
TIRGTVANATLENFHADAQANIVGYERNIDTVISQGDNFTLPFQSKPEERGVIFNISIPAEDYDLFTDVACQVLRPDSSTEFNSAFDYRTKTVPILFSENDSSANANNYILSIRPALALPERAHAWRLHITEQRYTRHNTYCIVSPSDIALFPFHSQALNFTSTTELPIPPNGYRNYGMVELSRSSEDKISVPIVW